MPLKFLHPVVNTGTHYFVKLCRILSCRAYSITHRYTFSFFFFYLLSVVNNHQWCVHLCNCMPSESLFLFFWVKLLNHFYFNIAFPFWETTKQFSEVHPQFRIWWDICVYSIFSSLNPTAFCLHTGCSEIAIWVSAESWWVEHLLMHMFLFVLSILKSLF